MIRTMIGFAAVVLVIGQREAASMPLELRVKQTQVVNSRNEPVRLRGVNTACLEWSKRR